jgi:hypothetical protein
VKITLESSHAILRQKTPGDLIPKICLAVSVLILITVVILISV